MTGPWLSDCSAPTLLGQDELFVRYRCRRESSGNERVVIAATREADPKGVSQRLDEVVRVLSLLDHPRIPKVERRGRESQTEFVELNCDGVIDAETFWRYHKDRGERTRYSFVTGLLHEVLTTLASAHDTIDPLTDAPVCLGTACWKNIFFSEDGESWLLGFGDPLISEATLEGGSGLGAVLRAPEVAMGERANRAADLVAMLSLSRTLFPLCRVPAPIERVLKNCPAPEDQPVAEAIGELWQRTFGPPQHRCQSVAEFLSSYRRVWDIMGEGHPDLPGFRTFASELIRQRKQSGAVAQELSCEPTGAWFQYGSTPKVDLSRRYVLRRLLTALLRERIAEVGRPLSTPALLEEGWPQEKMKPEAGARRVYVAICSLRKLGLGSVLQKVEDGYRLDPNIQVKRVDPRS